MVRGENTLDAGTIKKKNVSEILIPFFYFGKDANFIFLCHCLMNSFKPSFDRHENQIKIKILRFTVHDRISFINF